MSSNTLHLIEPGVPGCDPCTLAAVAKLAEENGDRVVVLGPHSAVDLAKNAGCTIESSFISIMGLHRLSRRAVTRVWETHRESQIIAWSEGAAVVASLLPEEVRVEARVAAVSPLAPWLEKTRKRRVHMRPVGEAIRPILSERGWSIESVIDIRDYDFPSSLPVFTREAVRAEWEVREGEMVVACVGDPAEAIILRDCYTAATIAHMAEKPIRIVMHPEAGGLSHGRDFISGMRKTHGSGVPQAVMDGRLSYPWQVSAGVDVVVMLQRNTRLQREVFSAFPVWWWLQSGVPLLASENALTQRIISNEGLSAVISIAGRNPLAAKLIEMSALWNGNSFGEKSDSSHSLPDEVTAPQDVK